MEERLMDDSREIPNEEIQATPEQQAVVEEQTDRAEEVAEESALDMTDTPAESIPPEGEIASSCEEMRTPQAEGPEPTPESLPAVQAGEALVEMLDATDGQETAPAEPGESDAQPPQSQPAGPEPTEQAGPEQESSPTIESVIEAVLFATDEPLQESRLAGIVETTPKQVRDCVESLNARYEANHNAFRIEQIAGGYQMLTQPLYNPWLKKMLKVRSDNKLSPAAMETLAIIAYKQPIIRADIEAIRGVAVGEVIRSLMYKGLVKIAGRAEILGRPMLYGTTKKFLEVFGLNSIKDLPKAEDLKNPDRG
ncbi:MAG TPA: SMC-Scp complex subunit ScpB [Sedimentisphaerales bacterium]|jgi:segregation and condensation protein B|nr:SMC-Scp complex subunit ScpB [Sedimentisphaerales bacterium]HNU31820.1 SMC-Scp complex subunit ScpB [Sedimentisphaerales bacterium]